MLSRLAIFVWWLLVLLIVLAAAEKPPAQFIPSGNFSGGVAVENAALTAVRFGQHSDYTRMVLDLAQRGPDGALHDAQQHPLYSVRYAEYPYRLLISLQDVWFDPQVEVVARPALPFSVIAREDRQAVDRRAPPPGQDPADLHRAAHRRLHGHRGLRPGRARRFPGGVPARGDGAGRSGGGGTSFFECQRGRTNGCGTKGNGVC
jgi:hypothetical protein